MVLNDAVAKLHSYTWEFWAKHKRKNIHQDFVLAHSWSHDQNRWSTVAHETFKYVVPRLKCHHSGCALVMTCQPRDNIFECSTCNRASFV